MNPLTPLLHLVGSGAMAYVLANQIRDEKTRPNVFAGFYFAESGSVPFLTKLRDRAQSEGDLWLAERLTKHANDERRHGQIFANALKQSGKEAIDLKALAETNSSEQAADKKEQSSPFFDAYYSDYSQADLKPEVIDWRVFLGSTYILEADACFDFRRMAGALDGVPNMDKVQAGIISVAEDEARHAGYLKEAMQRRYGYFATENLINEWRSRKVDALMAMVGNLIERRGKMHTLAQDSVDGEVEADTSLDLPVAA
ncbi:ferritin-like domain-containing protein [Oscillatoria sp. CS-180]|uniref:ferritin-like domain-containing protein n=1 Tax=Oscillatoria sp. CS-180 TaxID=3021720 RepID=UPI00232B4110|nr:ferritin-like domain-containing protein [Oscillatoria sp. CS-180]MDB9525473.1 ferritin-like domain-containing protein [Oscillatoria sp. CS-180]